MPPVAYTYAIDRDVAAGVRKVRRYGFHGPRTATSRLPRVLGMSAADVNVIVLHPAVLARAGCGGVSVDTLRASRRSRAW